MLPLSVVIIAKNEEVNIARCLDSVKPLGSEIILFDNGSTDRTMDIANEYGATVQEVKWMGYSETKNAGNLTASNDWIFSVDADEEMTEELRLSIRAVFIQTPYPLNAYTVQRRMVYCGKVLKYGSVSNEFRIRLFNRQIATWNKQEVHEELLFSKPIRIQKLKGILLHYSYNSGNEHLDRLEKYAQLSAQQMLLKKKQASFIKLKIAPSFGFIKNFIFKAGFLDGKAGYEFAIKEMWYAKRKYVLLKELNLGKPGL